VRLRNFLSVLSLVLLGLWLGAAVFLSAAVAPRVFSVLRGAELSNAGALAGAIVSELLGTINRGGFEIALLLIVISYFTTRDQKRLRRFAEMISLAIMAIMAALGHWVIAARMSGLRTAMQLPIDQIARDDPRRVAFDGLHRYSVVALSVAMIAGLVAFIVIASRGHRTNPEPLA